MDFTERLYALAHKVVDQHGAIQTEEATKNAFVMPFISTILGYDVFNPLEVVPEFTADVGVKKGEKIDYAVMREGEVQILIECKPSTSDLKIEHSSQLYRYFSVTNARIAILTNGILYHFYTDLDAPNRMDSRPYLILDLGEVDDVIIPELCKLTKEDFDLDSVISAAEELKYLGEIKRGIAAQFKDPSDEWVRILASPLVDGSFTQRVRDQFTPLVAKAASQFLTDQVNDRLKVALGSSDYRVPPNEDEEITNESQAVADMDLKHGAIETTEIELEGYHVVKAIACATVKPERIVHRDQKSYFAVLLDDNNRKPIARLHFNRTQKYIGIFDDQKTETRHPIDTLDEIYQFADQIRASVERYDV
ncbi:hypothetical protein GCM10011490_26300 [Pseudoclavibacter endophyticus]|uniref:Restriction endonuclease n=1 Tax=Pseudoclavibacter endophyticus TaxID=1778590 RepID=A0A6H9WFL8_9MICO|nr:type I restriction endonuclease [Pseudoclavibacter endophyticus]KAB1646928.1 restriction endonuclease [Pseudoclavibacter endophyticus]GGA74359.1 hypothetical protein GCM10011490_26300 [Pseudoclavibacter endophyticus]